MSNLFDVDFTKLSDKYFSMNLNQQNIILKESNTDLELRYLAYKNAFCTSMKWPVLSEIIEHCRSDKNMDNGLFFTFQLGVKTDRDTLHSINLYIDYNDVIISDPMIPLTRTIKWHSYKAKNTISLMYNGLFRISTYCKIDDNLDEFMIFFKKSKFKHLFDKIKNN